MSADQDHPIYLVNFYRLFRRLRDCTPVATLARRSTLDQIQLRLIESGRIPTDVKTAHHILASVFDLDERDINRLILGVQLYDLGLRDNAIRPMVVDAILRTLPTKARRQLRQLYLSYSAAE